ncbi:MAG: hypothetical protein RL375_1985 [Pseudomonadota bacterium]
MPTPVKLDDLLDAFDWVSSASTGSFDCDAFVHRITGAVVWVGESVNDEPPEDIDDGSIYLAVPDKSELGLGRSLALQFAEEYLPASFDRVRQFFGRPGAYGRFKDLLERAGQLEAWYAYERQAVAMALSAWCVENDLSAVGATGQLPR